MLFLFPERGFHSIWMKNCRVPLDIVWLDETLMIVYLETDVPPCRSDPCPGYAPIRKALYVLEIGAGMAARTGLRVGDTVRVKGVDLTDASPQ